MNTTNFAARLGVAPRILLAVGGIASLAFTGCQVDVGGQTLPSAYYLQDDIQYFPAGPEFKLSKEAAAQKAYRKEAGRVAAAATDRKGSVERGSPDGLRRSAFSGQVRRPIPLRPTAHAVRLLPGKCGVFPCFARPSPTP
jgi:hypothetical protein